MPGTEKELLIIAGREVAISNPRKVLFPQPGYTKLDLARYYLAVADGALRGAGGRPNVLVRYPDGIDGEFFYQKRAPRSRPPWVEVDAQFVGMIEIVGADGMRVQFQAGQVRHPDERRRIARHHFLGSTPGGELERDYFDPVGA